MSHYSHAVQAEQ